ncbi:MAG TPA: slipin family protein [Verrucomicrobiales bacterium]|nr:slipin family protein [Verrucomicrobiales bacterium]
MKELAMSQGDAAAAGVLAFTNLLPWIAVPVFLVLFVVPQVLRVLREYERGVVFRLGKLITAKGPGLVILIPVIDRMVKVDLRIITIDVPQQEAMTSDNVPVTVDAVVYFRVVNPQDAIVQVENFMKATSLMAQTTLRSVIGQAELDDLLSRRERINVEIQEILDRQTDPWGIKVSAVEVKDVILPDSMKRAMARQAETERDRRAKVINAEGEFQAAERLVEAAAKMQKQPISLQLRYLQTINEISSEHNTTTIFPVPIDIFAPFLNRINAAPQPAVPAGGETSGDGKEKEEPPAI